MSGKNCTCVLTAARSVTVQARQRGYTLVALLVVMTLMALLALAAAPSILQQAQREREKEAIFRGEEAASLARFSGSRSSFKNRRVAIDQTPFCGDGRFRPKHNALYLEQTANH